MKNKKKRYLFRILSASQNVIKSNTKCLNRRLHDRLSQTSICSIKLPAEEKYFFNRITNNIKQKKNVRI